MQCAASSPRYGEASDSWHAVKETLPATRPAPLANQRPAKTTSALRCAPRIPSASPEARLARTVPMTPKPSHSRDRAAGKKGRSATRRVASSLPLLFNVLIAMACSPRGAPWRVRSVGPAFQLRVSSRLPRPGEAADIITAGEGIGGTVLRLRGGKASFVGRHGSLRLLVAGAFCEAVGDVERSLAT